jgi:hypothetical protein
MTTAASHTRVLIPPPPTPLVLAMLMLLVVLLVGPFLGGAANGTKPPTARQSRPARQIQQ